MPQTRIFLLLIAALALGVGLLFIEQAVFYRQNGPWSWGSSDIALTLQGIMLSGVLACFGAMGIAASMIGLAVLGLKRQGVDWYSLSLFTLSSMVSLHYLCISNDNVYTNDVGWHIRYAEYISGHWLKPFGHEGHQSHHPPLYYYLAALMIRLTNVLTFIPTRTGLRFLSWAAYLIFNLFNLLTLRRAGLRGHGYRACVALLLFWPAGIHLASKINNEILYYAFYSAGFYFSLLWYQRGVPRHLMSAVILAGGAVTVRSNAILLFILTGLFTLIVWRRGRFDWRFLLSRHWMLAGVVVGLCLLINNGNLIAHPITIDALSRHWGFGTVVPFSFSHFLFFNYGYFLEHPFNDWTLRQSFWDYLLKTAIFGEYKWGWPELAAVLDAMLFLIVLYAMIPWLLARRDEWSGALPFMLGLVVPVLFLLLFAYWKHAVPNQDARLIYPALPCFVALFGRSQAIMKARGALLLAALGPALAWGFALLSIVFFWEQVR